MYPHTEILCGSHKMATYKTKDTTGTVTHTHCVYMQLHGGFDGWHGVRAELDQLC